jgi:DNA-binding NarL/FixJ family response regulator
MTVQKSNLNIVLASENPFFKANIIKTVDDFANQVSHLVADEKSLYQFVLASKPDILFLNGNSAIKLIQQIKSNFSLQTRCVFILPTLGEIDLIQCQHLLADAILCTDSNPEEYAVCIKSLTIGERFVSPQVNHKLFRYPAISEYQMLMKKLGNKEQEVFRYLGYNYPVKQIADILFVSPFTVESHRSNIIKKLGLSNAKELRQLTAKLVYAYQI